MNRAGEGKSKVKLYQNKFRVDSLRLAHYDYSAPGEYFVTICTEDKVCHFGALHDGAVQLSPIGLIVEEEWKKSAIIRSNITLDAYVVMPNHIHGIVVIGESFVETTGPVVSGKPSNRPVISGRAETTHRVVSTGNNPQSKTLHPNSLGSIVGQFKSVSTKRIRAAGYHDFGWQQGYYEHIIRDEKDLARIRDYIVMNPSRWDSDDHFARNVQMDRIHSGLYQR